MIRRRSNRSATTPASSPNNSHGSRCSTTASATRNGSRVCDATSSGPAASAMPSPRLLTQNDPSNHRNDGPSRAGAMTSARRVTCRASPTTGEAAAGEHRHAPCRAGSPPGRTAGRRRGPPRRRRGCPTPMTPIVSRAAGEPFPPGAGGAGRGAARTLATKSSFRELSHQYSGSWPPIGTTRLQPLHGRCSMNTQLRRWIAVGP